MLALIPLTAALSAIAPATPTVDVETLVDGTTLIHTQLPGDAPVAVRFVALGGGADDPQGRAGLAHLLEHLVFHGTYTEPEGEMWKRVTAAGGVMNAYTMPQSTTFVLDIPKEHFAEITVPFLAMVTSPALPFASLDRERGVVDAEHEDRPDVANLGWAIDQLVFPAANRALTVIGTAESRAAITLDDLTSFYATYCAPPNTSVIVVGDVTLEEVRLVVERGLRGAPGGAPPPPEEPETPNLPAEAKGLSFVIVTAHGRLVDGFSPGACDAAAGLLEIRLRKKVIADEQLVSWVNAFCHKERGHDFLVMSVVTSSPESSQVPTWMREVMRESLSVPATAREKGLVETRRRVSTSWTRARPASFAWALAFAAARDDVPIADAVKEVTRPPPLDWASVPRLLSAAASDKNLAELHFSRFEAQ
jgi:predicted Zn-dependent peptidase